MRDVKLARVIDTLCHCKLVRELDLLEARYEV
jgi:hypothetical protein